jgi:hypothetical protein
MFEKTTKAWRALANMKYGRYAMGCGVVTKHGGQKVGLLILHIILYQFIL